MSRLLARILLCMFMFPLAVVCYCCMVLTLMQSRGYDHFNYAIAGVTAWAFVAIYWTALWRNSICWSARRLIYPALAAVVGLFIGVFFSLLYDQYREEKWLLLSILIPTLWLISTVFAWRETPAERIARISASGRAAISCPTCGYNLTGLSEARCPECGTKYTLDELLAAQPGRDAGDL